MNSLEKFFDHFAPLVDGGRRQQVRVHHERGEDKLVAWFEMPGVEKENVTIQATGGILDISAHYTRGDDRIQYEWRGSVSDKYNTDEMTATMHHGMLEVHIPRHSAYRPRMIPVE